MSDAAEAIRYGRFDILVASVEGPSLLDYYAVSVGKWGKRWRTALQ
jgi:hypothetical protein